MKFFITTRQVTNEYLNLIKALKILKFIQTNTKINGLNRCDPLKHWGIRISLFIFSDMGRPNA
jgi:hypothetical protein